MPLCDAPAHIKLAVDLIQLLEENQIDTKTALDALAIVTRDYISKQDQEHESEQLIKSSL